MKKLNTYQIQRMNFMEDHYDMYPSQNGWHLFKCVCGRNKQMAFNPLYDTVKCFSAKCPLSKVGDYSDKTVDFIAKDMKLNRQKAFSIISNYRITTKNINVDKLLNKYNKQVTEIKLPDGFKNISEHDNILGQRAVKYLSNRGFDIDYLSELGFGYTTDPDSKFFGYIIIPFKKDNKLVYYIGRSFMPNLVKYYNPPVYQFNIGKSSLLFNEDALDDNEEIFLVEGWACAVTLGNNAISRQGSDLSIEQKSKIVRSNVKRVIIIPDYGFYRVDANIALQLQEAGKEVYLANTDKIVEELGLDPYYYNDVNSIGKEAVMNHVNDLLEFNEDDLWQTLDEDLLFM